MGARHGDAEVTTQSITHTTFEPWGSVVGQFSVGFLGSGTHTAFGAYADVIAGTGEPDHGYDFSCMFDEEREGTEEVPSGDHEIFAWFDYAPVGADVPLGEPRPYDNLSDIGVIADPSEVGFFILGGSLSGSTIQSNGQFTATIPDPGLGDNGNGNGGDTGSNGSNYNATPSGGTPTAYAGFSAALNTLLIEGAAINPNAPPTGTTVSQSGANVVVSTADGDVVLEDVDLSAWQAAAQTQILGSASAETATGTSAGELISLGAGDDTVYAGAGDDTISYHSDDDVIIGGKKNYGTDTLDLSQYNMDEVTFRVNGHDVFIDTPDGTIELDYQNRYDVGHTRTNIETITFADGTLDEGAIRSRSVNDLSTAGNDVVDGSYVNDIIVGSAGNDTLDAWYGDDTISYVSGNDQIIGGQGHDTLDLSQYTADEVTFRIDGHDVLIDTPDGTIELHYQVRYEVGHHATNIETLILSDATLDDAGIRDRALADQVTAGDDVIIGTLLHGDVLTTGAGDDSVTGFGGDDVFVFASGDGTDTITDFEDGNDLIRITGGPVAVDDVTVTEVNGDAVVAYSAADSITVEGISASLLTQEDFEFV